MRNSRLSCSMTDRSGLWRGSWLSFPRPLRPRASASIRALRGRKGGAWVTSRCGALRVAAGAAGGNEATNLAAGVAPFAGNCVPGDAPHETRKVVGVTWSTSFERACGPRCESEIRAPCEMRRQFRDPAIGPSGCGGICVPRLRGPAKALSINRCEWSEMCAPGDARSCLSGMAARSRFDRSNQMKRQRDGVVSRQHSGCPERIA
jgi:hypothetical protein